LVTPDLKALYRLDPVWKTLPVDRCFDLSLAAYLLNPEDRDYSWPRLAVRWVEQIADGVRADAHPGLAALQLHLLFSDRLRAARANRLMYFMEMPLIPVLARMEEAGIRIDRQGFAVLFSEVQTELDNLSGQIHHLAGGPFNIRSSRQLAELLFDTLHLPGAGKTRGGVASTSQEALEKLSGKHPLVDLLLEYRKLEKLRYTYLEPLPRLADAKGRVRTTFNLLATATGRLSSSNPNLQNIPVRGPLGRRIRACFIAGEGSLLVSADYSQIELRVLAHLSRDPVLLDAFRKGQDIHTRTASLLYGAEPEAVTPEQRRSAKTINFGLVYGMGPQKLAQDLGLSLAEAKDFIARYFERLSGLREFYQRVEQETRDQGFVVTLAGRRRYIPDIGSGNAHLRSQGKRQAVNTRVQGSAADIIKMAMLTVDRDQELRCMKARLLLQIHDELVLEVPESTAREAGERLAYLMEHVPAGLSVPLLVDWGLGRTWDAAHG
jgi:DNA polymerase-1